VIGENCVIEPLVRLTFTRMGDRCHVKSGAIIGGTGFGTAEDEKGIFNVPHIGRVIIHDDVYIGSNTCVDRGQLGDTVISKEVKIDNLVQIGHNVFIGEGTLIAGHAGISGSCVIGKKCIFAGKASLADHINVGDGAILAAFAGVMSDVPAGEPPSWRCCRIATRCFLLIASQLRMIRRCTRAHMSIQIGRFSRVISPSFRLCQGSY